MQYLEPPFSREQTARFLAGEGLCERPRILAVELSGTLAGYVIYHDYDENSVELGWVLSPRVWGQGLAQELTRRLIARAHAAGKGVVLECVPGQAATRHIAQKMGFSHTGRRDDLDVWRLSASFRTSGSHSPTHPQIPQSS